MNYWIFSVTPHKGEDYSLSAEEIFSQRMLDGFWGLNESNVNFNSLLEGDRIIFYVGRPKSVFAGNVSLASPGIRLAGDEKEELSHGISFYRADAGVLLKDIEIWENPQPVVILLPNLKFIKNKEKWYTHFQGGIIRISEEDYETILNSKERKFASGSDWSDEEVEETVASYFRMLRKELRGETYSKTAIRNELLAKIRRVKGAVEFKFQNISAALLSKGLPYVQGYKPLDNYQRLLSGVIDDYLEKNPQFLRVVEQSIDIASANEELQRPDFAEIIEEPPPTTSRVGESLESRRSYQARKYNYIKREAENRKLGEAGEKFVLEFEKHRLTNAGRGDLARRVERVSETKGDGAGYDIYSFEEDGAARFIEVKTTNFGKSVPFFISANELDFSQDYSSQYYLYRVFNFKHSPRLFILKGSLKEKFKIVPTTFRVSY